MLLLRQAWRGTAAARYRGRWRERLGCHGEPRLGARPIWIHAVSVGETMAAAPLVRALQERLPAVPILLTTTTATGADCAARMFGEDVRHAFFPYDLPFAVKRFLACFAPRVLVVMETELWPNTFGVCAAHGVPVVLANARLSARSARGYRRVAALAREVVRTIDHIAAQSQDDAARFVELGADAERIAVIGSLKFDVELPPSIYEQAAAVRRDLGVNRPVLIAASTRDGEEALVLDAFAELCATWPATLLILVPRHPERFDEVANLCSARGFEVQRRSECAPCGAGVRVFLVDSMGELPRFYAAADIAFVGGSLLPFGGHNVLEPAMLARPVLVGPHTFNFSEVVRLLHDAGALRVVSDVDELARAARAWLEDSNERDRVGRLAREIVHRHRGATQRTVGEIERLMVKPATAAAANRVA